MALLPNAGPPIPSTHKPIDPALTAKLAASLAARAGSGRVTMTHVDAVAAEHSATRAQTYAAMATNPNLVFDISQPTLLAVCVGGCQMQGAIPVLQKLLDTREERLGAGKKAFDVVVRTCLDMCPHSPVAISRSPHGQAAHPRLSPEGVGEIISALCDD
jgi:hypothetical protein